jgi:S-formylglutathione hydrolase FrmB
LSPSRPTRRQIQRRRRAAGGLLALTAIAAAYLALTATVLAPTDTHGAKVERMTIHSKAVDEDLDVSVVLPPGSPGDRGKQALLVFLHGRGGSADTFTGNEAMFEALRRLGGKAPIVAFPDGGDHGYWHDRGEGGWGTYVTDEAIPEVSRRFGADPSRVAIGGISMGGFGAYDLALLHPGRFCAVGGHSPALWLEGGDSAPGAFDDAEDFERHDVIEAVKADPSAFGETLIWNDAGKEDPFLVSDVQLVEALEAGSADVSSHVWPGGHDQDYWDEHWLAYLRFYADALTNCTR